MKNIFTILLLLSALLVQSQTKIDLATQTKGVLPAANGGSPLTTKGDLPAFDTSLTRLAIGGDGLCLVADSTQVKGFKWGTCATGAGTNYQTIKVDSIAQVQQPILNLLTAFSCANSVGATSTDCGLKDPLSLGVFNATTGFRVAGAASAGKVLIGNGTNFIPGDPLVQGLFAEGNTTVQNPVSIGGFNTAGTPAIHGINVINGPPSGTEYGIVARTIPSGTQTISGSVSVSNFPATQPISGTVGVNNFPASQTINGTVTANSGTNLNTSLLALETGGNLATIAAKDFATQTTLALIKAKTDNLDVLLSTRTKSADQQHAIVDSGHLIIDSGSTTAVTGNVTVVQPTGTNLHMVCDTGCSSSAGFADNATFTVGTTASNPVGGLFDDTPPTAIVAGKAASARITNNRALHINIRNQAGTELGTVSNPLQVTLNGATPAGTNVIGHFIADSGSTTVVTGNVAVTNSGLSNIDVLLSTRTKPSDQQHTIIDSATIGQLPAALDGSGFLKTHEQGTATITGTVTANAGTGTFTNQQTNITADYDTSAGTQTLTMFGLALPASGGAVAAPGDSTNGLKVQITTAPTIAVTGVFFQATQPVSGTITANAGTGTFTVSGTVTSNIGTTNGLALDATLTGGTLKAQGNVASGVSDSGNPIKIGGIFNTTQPTVTTGQRIDAQMSARGEQFIAKGVSGFTIDNTGFNVTGSLPAGSALIGHVINDSGSTTAITGNVTVIQPTGTNLHAVLDTTSTTAVTQATGTNLHMVVDSGTITAVTAITNSLPAGTNVLGHMIIDSGSTTVVTGNVAVTNTGLTDLDATFQTVTNGTAATKSQLIGGVFNTALPTLTNGQGSALQANAKGELIIAQPTAGDLNATVTGTVALSAGAAVIGHVIVDTAPSTAVTNAGTFAVQAAQSGTWNNRTQDGAGNALTSNSATFTAKFGLDSNLLGTLGTAFTTPGFIDIKGADGNVFVRQATGTNLHTVLDSGTLTTVTAVTAITNALPAGTNLLGHIIVDTAPSTAVTNAGTFAVQSTNAAETTKVIGTVRMLGNVGGVLDAIGQNVAAPANWLATGCVFFTSPTTLTTGDGSYLNCDAAGNQLVKINAALPAGTNLLGKVGVDQTTPGTTNAVEVVPDTASAVALTPSAKATLTTAVVVKASAGNVYGFSVTNGAASVCWIEFMNASASPVLGTAAIFSVALPASGTVNMGPGDFALANFSTGISVGIATLVNGSTACGTAGNATIFFK